MGHKSRGEEEVIDLRRRSAASETDSAGAEQTSGGAGACLQTAAEGFDPPRTHQRSSGLKQAL